MDERKEEKVMKKGHKRNDTAFNSFSPGVK